MRFIWVNDRVPSSHSVCAACGRSIGSTYLRHIETRRCYCDPGCYASVRPDNLEIGLEIGPLTQDQTAAILEFALLQRSGDSDLGRC